MHVGEILVALLEVSSWLCIRQSCLDHVFKICLVRLVIMDLFPFPCLDHYISVSKEKDLQIPFAIVCT